MIEFLIYGGAIALVTWLVVKSYKWRQRTGNPTPPPPPPKKTGNPTPPPPPPKKD